MTIQSSSLRKRILKQSNVQPSKHKRKMQTVPQQPPPKFPKTKAMMLVELQHTILLEDVIFKGTIDQAAFKYSIDRSTVSKWRKYIKEQMFWENFT